MLNKFDNLIKLYTQPSFQGSSIYIKPRTNTHQPVVTTKLGFWILLPTFMPFRKPSPKLALLISKNIIKLDKSSLNQISMIRTRFDFSYFFSK